jgi:hypothetical protein
MKKLILLFVAIALLSSCVTQKRCNKRFPCSGKTDTVTRTDYIETLKDTMIYLTDSAFAQLYFECDKNGDVLLKKIMELQSGHYINPKVIFKDKILYVNCNIDSAGILLHYKNILIKDFQKINNTVIVKENYFTKWQSFQIWVGRIFMILLILLIIYTIIRNIYNINGFFKLPK